MLENSKIVYVAHPYGGLSSNYDKVSDIMRLLCDKFSDKTFVSPIHAYGFMYESVDYNKGINLCFKLLYSYVVNGNILKVVIWKRIML